MTKNIAGYMGEIYLGEQVWTVPPYRVARTRGQAEPYVDVFFNDPDKAVAITGTGKDGAKETVVLSRDEIRGFKIASICGDSRGKCVLVLEYGKDQEVLLGVAYQTGATLSDWVRSVHDGLGIDREFFFFLNETQAKITGSSNDIIGLQSNREHDLFSVICEDNTVPDALIVTQYGVRLAGPLIGEKADNGFCANYRVLSAVDVDGFRIKNVNVIEQKIVLDYNGDSVAEIGTWHGPKSISETWVMQVNELLEKPTRSVAACPACRGPSYRV
ncbi:MAG: hypothetical protein PHE27_00165 [Alphaproteobacteria bacterium]|nr:hypothetical protein [Alphaproteobacteria bacterium]